VHALEQGHNHNLDRVTLNYPCPVSRLRVIRHNRTKCRENGTHEQHYFFFLSIMTMQVTTHLLDPGWGPEPPRGSGATQGARHRRALTLMVGAFGSLALTPPRGPLSMFLSVDGGCSRIPPSMFLSNDGGRSGIPSSGTSQGTRR
jgi:hypothetical protein